VPDDDDYEESTAIFSIGPLGLNASPPDFRHVLVRMDGSDVGKVIALSPEGVFMIGRRSDCDMPLKYEGVSRQHARITFVDGAYVLEDLGSSNGTLVRGRRIDAHRLEDGDVLQFGPLVSVRYSITDRDEEGLLRHLYEASVRDPLTGAYNREYLSERLKSEIAFALRHGTDTALLMFDLDHFKQVNDKYGHQAGDAVLIEVVKTVIGDLRTEDVLARYGGEEFAVSVRGIDVRGAARLGERIRQQNHRVVMFEGQEIPVSLSVGCAAASELPEPSAEALIATADKRLYAAKKSGRNRVAAS
jgi:two-component system, cell cycle response regulator